MHNIMYALFGKLKVKMPGVSLIQERNRRHRERAEQPDRNIRDMQAKELTAYKDRFWDRLSTDQKRVALQAIAGLLMSGTKNSRYHMQVDYMTCPAHSNRLGDISSGLVGASGPPPIRSILRREASRGFFRRAEREARL